MSTASPVLITGANGYLGRRLITALAPNRAVRALVRSAAARDTILNSMVSPAEVDIRIIDPLDGAAIAAAGAGCRTAVHLIGTIRSSPGNTLLDAHDRAARALLVAAERLGLSHIVYLSILGADVDSRSECLRRRATVEQLLVNAAVSASVVRVPMVLGEDNPASRALARRAVAKRVLMWRGASREQPIYAGDVIAALQACLKQTEPRTRILDLAGPESLSRCALVARAAARLGQPRPLLLSLPMALGLAFTRAAQLIKGDSYRGVTADMLRVLDHDDAIDPAPAADLLGLRLCALDEMLERCIGRC